MENLTLLQRFANPELIHGMSLGEKFLASIYVTILGMGVTFVALIILWGVIAVMSRVLNTTRPKKEAVQVAKPPVEEQKTAAADENIVEDEELIAVITAAIAASLNTTTHNIIVKNIVRVPDTTPIWGRMGRLEQMNSRF